MSNGFASLLLIICSLCIVTDAAKLRESCEPLLNSTWVHLCNGVITKEIKIKYKDQLTTVGTPFKIMTMAKETRASLITFFDSEIQNSTWIAINTNMTITLSRSKEIKMKPKMFYCFNFGLEYMADLLNLCFEQADSLAKLKCQCLYTVLHYSYMPPLVSAQVRLNADVAVHFISIAMFLSLIQMQRNHL